MAHITGHNRSQTLLFPEAIDDYVGSDNPVRFTDAFVDGLDLAAAGFGGIDAKPMGRLGYAPADLLKLYIYGYPNRIRSSCRLEVETHRNIEVIWLLRHLKPDFKTVADFRRDNHAAFKPVFCEFVLLCRQLDLFGPKAGFWADLATEESGDALDLVAAVLSRGDLRPALDWTRAWLGLDFGGEVTLQGHPHSTFQLSGTACLDMRAIMRGPA